MLYTVAPEHTLGKIQQQRILGVLEPLAETLDAVWAWTCPHVLPRTTL